MVVKVGSAGPVIDSVIQYTQNENKQDWSELKPEKDEAKRAVKNSAGTSMLDGRLTTSSERAHQANTKVADIGKNALPVNDTMQNYVPAQNVVTVENADGEVIENRTGLELSQEAVKITVEDVNKRIAPKGAEVAFSYHEKTGRYSFKVLEKETGKVLREVPPHKSLDMVAKMFEMVGLIVDEKL